MKRTTKYVALDVHQATAVSSVRDETGRVIVRTIIPTDAESLLALVRSVRGVVHVVFEEGTQAQWLSELLTPGVQRVVGNGFSASAVNEHASASRLRSTGRRC